MGTMVQEMYKYRSLYMQDLGRILQQYLDKVTLDLICN